MAEIVDLAEREALLRARKRGCILKAIMVWFGILAAIILAMIFVRSRVNRDPEAIREQVERLIAIELPEGFYPYSMSRFMGVQLYSFWNKNHLQKDERTTSVIAVYTEDTWRGQDADTVERAVVPKLEDKLDRNEFRAQEHHVSRIPKEGGEVVIHRFSGIQRIDEAFLPATTCYRFIDTAQGPLQIQTIGLNDNFGADAQIAFLSSIASK